LPISKAEWRARRDRREALAAENRAKIEPCVLEGWSLREIYRTYGVSARSVKRLFPDYTGMPAVESGSLSMAIQRNRRVFSESV
jgi:AraC-like DNA-binding protein